MNEFIFLNPSPNLAGIAEFVKHCGNRVRLVNNGQFPPISAKNVHCFSGGSYTTARGDVSGKEPNTDLCNKTKKTLFSGFISKKISGALSEFGNDMTCGNIVDLYLLRSGAVDSYRIEDQTGEPVSFQTISNENPEATIVTSYMEFLAGSEKMCMFDTDFDLKEALGEDYFILFTHDGRLEICAQGNRLITIGSKTLDHLRFLQGIFPFMKHFTFKRVKELVISRNRQPWALSHVDKRLVLVNDYSYFNISVKMPSSWTEKVGKMLCSEKQR
ncbi:hypothetical protein [Limisalsivibrio acetivorans]|uniref:hypothetical protein n=1 Tax=Limisalsivibrio acetivorans TaxID=1304888 RepID=UPI0003B684E6|nr:hypothetical protein [Limisalsivibrio acetivorans]